MIASPVPIVILFLLPVCCGAIVIFGLLLRRRVIIGSLGIAALVLCIVGAACWGARPGRLAGAWPCARWAHLPAVLHAKIPPEVRLLDSDLAEIERSGQEVVLPVIVQA